MTTTPEPTNEPWSKTLLDMLKGIGKLAAWAVGLALVVGFALAGYDAIDVGGYISHDQTTDVFMSSDWLVGENRLCSLTEFLDAKGKPTGKVLSVTCPQEEKKLDPHNMSVTFKGVLDPKDMDGKERPISIWWTCTRGSGSFTCVPVATSAKP
jgi:hypothetical protein